MQYPVVKSLCGDMCELQKVRRIGQVVSIGIDSYTDVSKTVPLSTALRVQGVCVIEYNIFSDSLDVVGERFAVECWFCRHIERKAINFQ